MTLVTMVLVASTSASTVRISLSSTLFSPTLAASPAFSCSISSSRLHSPSSRPRAWASFSSCSYSFSVTFAAYGSITGFGHSIQNTPVAIRQATRRLVSQESINYCAVTKKAPYCAIAHHLSSFQQVTAQYSKSTAQHPSYGWRVACRTRCAAPLLLLAPSNALPVLRMIQHKSFAAIYK